MASSTSNIDNLIQSQASKEVTANAYFDAASPGTLYGRRASTTSGLTWGYYGGRVRVAGVSTSIANGTRTLSASTTNYVEADATTGAVSHNTTGFTAGRIPLYSVVTGASTVTSYTDHRAFAIQAGYASADQAAVVASPTVEQLATLVNALRDALVKSGIIKGSA